MIPTLNRHRVGSLLRFNGRALCGFLLLFPALVFGQFAQPDADSARSVSGQFFVKLEPGFSPFANQPGIATNANFLHLEPALLAVSAERTGENLRQLLDIGLTSRWRGRIYFALHPARSLDENVIIVSQPFGDVWNYQVRLPDVIARERFTRALTGVLLLEYANRNAGQHPAEIPAWLNDGLARQLLAVSGREISLSSPTRVTDGILQNQTVASQSGADFLADARRILRNTPALTFEQLSWPTPDQLSANDGGVYRASAHLFVTELLRLKNGSAKIRVMLESLPACYNWQTAFLKAFRENFATMRDVEKWWALQTVNFIARDPGPLWTPAFSRDKLRELLSVPVEIRTASNALPVHAEISLQAVIRNWDAARRTEILQLKLRDLDLARLRMALPFAVLANDYRQALGDFLGERTGAETNQRVIVKRNSSHAANKTDAKNTLKKLDELDVRRRQLETDIDNGQPAGQSPEKLNVKPPGRST